MDSALSASDEGANDVDRSSLRGQLQWQPTDALLEFVGGSTTHRYSGTGDMIATLCDGRRLGSRCRTGRRWP